MAAYQYSADGELCQSDTATGGRLKKHTRAPLSPAQRGSAARRTTATLALNFALAGSRGWPPGGPVSRPGPGQATARAFAAAPRRLCAWHVVHIGLGQLLRRPKMILFLMWAASGAKVPLSGLPMGIRHEAAVLEKT